MKRIPVYVPEEHHEQIRVLAFNNKVSMAEEIRKAVAEYLRRENDFRVNDLISTAKFKREFKLEEGDKDE